MRYQQASVKYLEFQVEGRGPFPTDMLRYDGCYPASSRDATEMIYESHDPDRRRLRRITLRCVAHHGRPSHGRWASFSWIVVPDSIRETSG